MRRAETVALGLLHGPVELLPVSSSGHIAAVPWLLDWEVSRDDGGRRTELAVALHAGTALALLLTVSRETVRRPRVALLAAGVLPPALAGLLLQGPVQRRLGTPGTLAAGLLAGGAALALADLAPAGRAAEDADWRDGLWLGLAQCAALWPGVSRSGATLAAARARGFARPDASRLSWEVGLPVLIGAAVRKRPRREPEAAVAAYASTLATARAVGLERHRPLWPWAAWRAALAAAVLIVRQNRARD
jgi:undecaprenyl-diphosphatase